MPACELTIDLIPSDCLSQPTGGTTGAAYGISYEKWLNATLTVGANGEISAIAPASGDKFIKYDLPRGATIPTTPLTVNTGGKSGFAHTLVMFVPSKAQDVRDEIAGFANYNKMVWIVVLEGADVPARTLGAENGLSLTAYDELENDPAQGAGFNATFATPADNTLENRPPVNFFNTDRATTLAALEALLTPAP